jgi:hypothetical protein
LKRLLKVGGLQSPDCKRFSSGQSDSHRDLKAKFSVCSIAKISACLIDATRLGETSMVRTLAEICAVSEGGSEDRRCLFRSKMEMKIDDIWGTFSIVDGRGKSSLAVLFPRETKFIAMLVLTDRALKQERHAAFHSSQGGFEAKADAMISRMSAKVNCL